MSNEQNKYPLVLVEWEDSQRPLSAWQWIDEFSLPDAVRCLSVGFLIAKTELALALAPNLGGVEQEREQACGIIRIPASAVITLSHPQLPGNSSPFDARPALRKAHTLLMFASSISNAILGINIGPSNK